MSLYNAFGDKDDAFLFVLNRYIDATKRLYEKHMGDGGIADLEALIGAYTKPDRLGPAGTWGCLMLNAITAADGVNAKARRTIESFRLYAIDQIKAALIRATKLGEVDPAIDAQEMAEFILITMWGAKAAIRHAGSTEAAAPVSQMLPLILRALRLSRPRLSDRRTPRRRVS